MAAPVADTLVAPAGATPARFGRGTPAAVLPFSLQFDGPTSQQLSLYCPVTGTVATGAQVLAWYRQQGTSTWLGGVALYRSLPANANLPGAVEYFAGMLLGVQPGTTYEVRCDYVVSGQATQSITATTTTRAWPAAAGAPTITASPGTLASILAQTLAPGTVLYIPDGNYTLPANAVVKSAGTAQQPVYVLGQSKTGTVLTRAWSGTALEFLLQIQGSHVVIDGLGLQGSGVDSGQNAYSRCFAATRVAGQTQPSENITIRNCRARGFDVFEGSADAVLGRLTYNNDVGGNNPANLIGVVSAQGFQGQDGWNDTAFRTPGNGCEVFNNTVFGFGDTVKFTDAAHSAGYLARACFAHRNLVLYAADDGAGELDDAARNCALYDNTVMGAATLFSADDTFGGPFIVARNVGINIARHPFKLEGTSQGVTVANNTLVERGRMTGRTHGIQMPSGANPIDWRFANNLMVTNVPGDAVQIASGTMPGLRVQNNGYTQDAGFQFGQGVRSATLAQAKIDRPAIHATDLVVETQPFATAVPLGADFTVQYTGNAAVALAAGSAARGAGVHIPGITDGYTGAAPDIGAAISGQAAVAYGAPTFEWSNLAPLTLPTMPAAGTIGTLGTSVLNSVATGGAEETFQYPKVLGAWGSALLVRLYNATGQLVDVLYVIQGGGHGDSGWDGVAYFSLRQQAFLLALAPEHLAAVAIEADTALNPWGEHASGRPASAHPWTHNVGIDGDELGGPAFIRTRGAGAGQSGTVFGGSHDFFWATKQFTRRGSTAAPATAQSIHVTIKDRTRGLIHRFPCSPNGDYYTLDYRAAGSAWATRTQALRTGLGWTDTNSANGCHVPQHDLLVACNFTGAGSLRALPAGATDGTWVSLPTTGLELPTQRVGLQYRSATGSILMMDMSTAVPTGVFEVTPPTTQPLTNAWTVTRRAFTGSSSLAIYAGLREIVDRYQYVHELDALMACPSPTAPMETWKL